MKDSGGEPAGLRRAGGTGRMSWRSLASRVRAGDGLYAIAHKISLYASAYIDDLYAFARRFLEGAQFPGIAVAPVARGSLPASVVQAIFDELANDLPVAIDTTCAKLPDDFPDEVRRSISAGALQRLERIAASRA